MPEQFDAREEGQRWAGILEPLALPVAASERTIIQERTRALLRGFATDWRGLDGEDP